MVADSETYLDSDWSPSGIVAIALRAEAVNGIRDFFQSRKVLEVFTPNLSQAATTDPNIHSLQVITQHGARWLHTSPELAMKRLLCANVGDCYQITQVYRDGEQGRIHNTEFQLLEWYRLGFSLSDLMREVLDLIQQLNQTVAKPSAATLSTRELSYQAAFEHYLKTNPLTATQSELNAILVQHDLWEVVQPEDELPSDAALDLLFDQCIAKAFDINQITVVYDYPASQASLAALNEDGKTAQRFEVYWGSTELANGFFELRDADVQRQRFEADNHKRVEAGKPMMPIDARFLSALELGGLPECSGVALGIDRLLMKLGGYSHIRDVLSFDFERA